MRHFESTLTNLLLEREHASRSALRSGSSNRKLRATAEPDLDGRTVRGPQSRHRGVSEENRENLSDLAHLGLDLVSGVKPDNDM